LSAEELIRRLENCLTYSIKESSIVLENVCDFPIDIRAIEIEYYIYISRAQAAQSTEHVELGRFRKRVFERVSIEQVLQPSTSLNIYFGIIKNIENVYVVVNIDDKQYRVKVLEKKENK